MHRGFIKIWRKIEDWEWFSEPNTMLLFIHLLILANHKDKNWKGKEIKRGHLITSLSKLSQRTGLSVQNVRTAIEHLTSTQEVTHYQHNKYTHISINNYSEYHELTQQLTDNQHKGNTKVTTTKNEKNEKNIYTSNESKIFSYFSFKEKIEENEMVAQIAKEFDIRPKDVIWCVRDMLSKSSDKEIEIKNVKAKLNTWINNAIRWHNVATLTSKEETKPKPKLTEDQQLAMLAIKKREELLKNAKKTNS